jgi:hypothetical protein
MIIVAATAVRAPPPLSRYKYIRHLNRSTRASTIIRELAAAQVQHVISAWKSTLQVQAADHFEQLF